MRIERITNIDAMRASSAEWERLAVGNPFLSWAWLSNWWRNFQDNKQLYLIVGRDEHERILGIAPWFIESSPTRGRRVKFLGNGEVCSDYLSLITREDSSVPFVAAVANWLNAANDVSQPDYQPENRWDFLSFEGVAEQDRVMSAFQQEMKQLGHTLEHDRGMDCWRNEIGDRWEQYLSKLPSKSRRRKVKNVLRKYIESQDVHFEVAESMAQFEDFYATFVDLHQRRRTSLGECGCFASESFAQFLYDASKTFFEQNQLLLSRCTIAGQPIAASLGFLANGVHYMYQTGMDPEMSCSNPGWVMNVSNIRFAFEHGIQSIDYLRGDETYKAKIGAQPIEMLKFRIVAKHTPAMLRNTAWKMRDSLKQSLSTLANCGWPTSSTASTGE